MLGDPHYVLEKGDAKDTLILHLPYSLFSTDLLKGPHIYALYITYRITTDMLL